jgi:hypothetical protein
LRRLPGLVAVALLVWWPVLVFGGAVMAYYAPTSADSFTDSANGGILVLICCLPVFLVLGGLLFWPLQRLANCALVLDGLGPLLAVRAAWRLFWGRFGTVVGLWLALLALNGLLVLISILLAALAAALVYAVWGVLNGPSEGTALALIAAVAGVLGLGLLFWDGVITAFNLGTWVLAYRELTAGSRGPGTVAEPLPVSAAGSTQLLGRSRQ